MLDDVALRTVETAFVGRDAELARLREAFTRVRSGEPAAVIVGGEAGVGKTRLVNEFTGTARGQGALVLGGQCVELGGEGLPFAPFVGILRDLLRQQGAAAFDGCAGPGAGQGQLFDAVAGLYGWPLVAAAARVAATATDIDLGDRVRAAAVRLPARFPAESGHAADVAAELAALDPGTGPADELTARRAAVSAWRAGGQPYPLAWALLGFAEVAAGTGDRAGAERAIEEADRIAARLAAAPLRDRAGLLARRLGLRAAEAVGDLLTGREIEVLRLVAEGHSNRRIGEALFISTKTASVHVSHILAKLSVSRRGEAVAVAHRLGLLAAPAGTPADGRTGS